MTKATRIINKYHIKEMLLNGNPQFENFYKEDLIKFCEVARELIKENNQANLLVNCIKKYKEVIDTLEFIKARAKEGATQETINKLAISFINSYIGEVK